MLSFLKFQVSYQTQPNETVRIAGNIKDLGEWNSEKALSLQTNASIYPEWTHDTFIEIPFGTDVEFKCAIYHGDRLTRWETLPPFDGNRKYKTQYFKALLFMKEGQAHLLERPFQKYLGNHDCDIINTTNAKKIQEKFIIFDPLRKADGLVINRPPAAAVCLNSSSSDNSSIEFFCKQSSSSSFSPSKHQDGEDDSDEERSRDIKIKKKRASKVKAATKEGEDDGGNGEEEEQKHSSETSSLSPSPPPPASAAAALREAREGRSTKLLPFSHSSLSKIDGKVPDSLKSILLLFNRLRRDVLNSERKKAPPPLPLPTGKKITDFSQSNNALTSYSCSAEDRQQQQNPLPALPPQQTKHRSSKEETVHSMPEVCSQMSERSSEQTLIIVSCSMPFIVRPKRRRNSMPMTCNSKPQPNVVLSSYEFIQNSDPVICSIYHSLVDVKLNVIWVGICEVFIESPDEQKELQQYMMQRYSCYPLFVCEPTFEMFSRQFCGKLLYSLRDQSSTCFYEEDESWKAYKDVNMHVAQALTILTADYAPVFAIACYDCHFFLVPSFFHKLYKQPSVNLFNHHHRADDKKKQAQAQPSPTLAFFTNRKFPQVQILETLPQADMLLHSLFFCDVMTFATYEAAEPFLVFSENMGCSLLHKPSGKIVLQCNGREISIRIAHPGINIIKLEETRRLIQPECTHRQELLLSHKKHLVVGIDDLSRNSGLELKFSAFAKFLKRERCSASSSTAAISPGYKLKQLVYFSTDSEFSSITEQQEYLEDLRTLARSINQQHSFYDSAIELIEAESLSFEDFYSFLYLSDCFFSTTLQPTHHFHYMEYLLLKREGQVILTDCLPQISQFNAINIVNPQDQQRLVFILSKIFKQIAAATTTITPTTTNTHCSRSSNKNGNPQLDTGGVLTVPPSIAPSLKRSNLLNDNPHHSIVLLPRLSIDHSSVASSSSSSSSSSASNVKQSEHVNAKIHIVDRNSTSEGAQREFDYNYLRRFCSSHQYIRYFIGDIVKRKAATATTTATTTTTAATCTFQTIELKTVQLKASVVYREEIVKTYQRSTSNEAKINLSNLLYKSQHSKNSVFIFGFSSVFFEHTANLIAEPKPNQLLFDQITQLASKPTNHVYIITAKSPGLLDKYLSNIPNITVFAHNGLYVQITGRGGEEEGGEPIMLTSPSQSNSTSDPAFWKMCVASRIEDFVVKTPGSYMTESDITMSWHYEHVQREFAAFQRDEIFHSLLPLVQTMPGYEIYQGHDFVQVRPSCHNKGSMTKIALHNSLITEGKQVDLLVVVSGRKTTDEEMLKTTREVMNDEKLDIISKHATVILGQISSQLGALYCNHQFENNQELAALLQLINGNKTQLKSDSIWKDTNNPNSHKFHSPDQTATEQTQAPLCYSFEQIKGEEQLITSEEIDLVDDTSLRMHLLEPIVLQSVQSSVFTINQTEELLQKRLKAKTFDSPFTQSLNFINQ